MEQAGQTNEYRTTRVRGTVTPDTTGKEQGPRPETTTEVRNQAEQRVKGRGLLARSTLLALALSFSPIAHAADETPAGQPPARAKSASGADTVKSATAQKALEALMREEEEMRRREDEMLRKAASKAKGPRQEAAPSSASSAITPQPTATKPAEAALKKPAAQPSRKKRALPPPTPTSTPSPEPTLVKFKKIKSSESPTPVPTETPVPTSSAKAATPRPGKTKAPKPTPSPRPSADAAKPVVPTPASANGQGVVPTSAPKLPSAAAKTTDASTGLLREQLTALTARNRELETELETLRSQLAILETEVERLNDFLNEQGRDYLNRATGGAPAARNPAPQRSFGERLSGRPPRLAPEASSRTGSIQRSPFEPARSLETDQTVSIASVVSSSAVGREGPSSSAAIIDRIPAGSQVTVEREAQGWYRVLTPLGVRVWVSAKDLAFGADGSVPPIRRDQSSSILPPEQPASPHGQLAASGASPEDRALELLKQSMGQQQ